MGVELKWLLNPDQKLFSLLQVSLEERGIKFDFKAFASIYKKYRQALHEYQQVRFKANKIQKQLQQVLSDDESVTLLKEEAREARTVAKTLECQAKELRSFLENERLKVPNVLNYNKIIVAPSNSLGDYTLPSKQPVIECGQEYLIKRFPFLEPAYLGNSYSTLTRYRGKWFDENGELPFGLIGVKENKAVLALFLIKAEKSADDAVFSNLVLATKEFFEYISNNIAGLSIKEVLPKDLNPEETRAYDISNLESKLKGNISCSNDYVTREFELRCGSKKRLQQWKKYVFLVRLWWNFPEKTECNRLDTCMIEPFSLVSQEIECELNPPNNIHNERELALFEAWLRINSFYGGAFKTSKDYQIFEQMKSYHRNIPAVQYPSIHRWMSTF